MTPNRPWRRVRRVAPTSSITGMQFRYPMSTRIGLAAQAEIATFLCPLFMYRVIHLSSRLRLSLSTGVWTKSVEDRWLTTDGPSWRLGTSGRGRPSRLVRRDSTLAHQGPALPGSRLVPVRRVWDAHPASDAVHALRRAHHAAPPPLQARRCASTTRRRSSTRSFVRERDSAFSRSPTRRAARTSRTYATRSPR